MVETPAAAAAAVMAGSYPVRSLRSFAVYYSYDVVRIVRTICTPW